jgi:hypothetical protein
MYVYGKNELNEQSKRNNRVYLKITEFDFL